MFSIGYEANFGRFGGSYTRIIVNPIAVPARIEKDLTLPANARRLLDQTDVNHMTRRSHVSFIHATIGLNIGWIIRDCYRYAYE